MTLPHSKEQLRRGMVFVLSRVRELLKPEFNINYLILANLIFEYEWGNVIFSE